MFASFIHVALGLISFESLPSKTAHWSTYLALYEERHDQQTQACETHAHVCIRRLLPPVLFLWSHTGSSPHVVFNRQTFLASILNYSFPQGEGTSCLVIEHVAVPWYAFYVLVFHLEQQSWGLLSRCRPEGNGDYVPPARGVDLLINSRVHLSCGSQECSGTCSSLYDGRWGSGLSFSLFMSIITGSDNHSLFGC